MKIIFTILMISFFSFSALAQKGKWKKASEANTIDAYETFISNYPESKYTIIATSRIIEKRFRAAKNLNTIESYQSFVSTHPKCQYVNRANDSIHKFAFQNTINIGSIEGYKNFLEHYTNTIYTDRLKEYYDVIQKKEINKYKAYIHNNPNSIFLKDAKNRLIILQTKAIEDAILSVSCTTINDSIDFRESGAYYLAGARRPGIPPSEGYTYLITSVTLNPGLYLDIDYESDIRVVYDDKALTTYKPDNSAMIIFDDNKLVDKIDLSQDNAWWECGEKLFLKDFKKELIFLNIVPIEKIAKLKCNIFNCNIDIPKPVY